MYNSDNELGKKIYEATERTIADINYRFSLFAADS